MARRHNTIRTRCESSGPYVCSAPAIGRPSELGLGDRPRESIDGGLSWNRFPAVALFPAFFCETSGTDPLFPVFTRVLEIRLSHGVCM